MKPNVEELKKIAEKYNFILIEEHLNGPNSVTGHVLVHHDVIFTLKYPSNTIWLYIKLEDHTSRPFIIDINQLESFMILTTYNSLNALFKRLHSE